MAPHEGTTVTTELDAPAQDLPDAHVEAPVRKRRIFSLSLSGTGVVVGGFFFAISLLPSLLPRAPYVQGVVSGITLMIGYGLGAGGQALWDYLEIPKLQGPGAHDRARDPRGAHRVDDGPRRLAAGRLAERHPRAVRDGAGLADGPGR